MAMGTENDGDWLWRLPLLNTDQARIRIDSGTDYGTSNIFSARSTVQNMLELLSGQLRLTFRWRADQNGSWVDLDWDRRIMHPGNHRKTIFDIMEQGAVGGYKIEIDDIDGALYREWFDRQTGTQPLRREVQVAARMVTYEPVEGTSDEFIFNQARISKLRWSNGICSMELRDMFAATKEALLQHDVEWAGDHGYDGTAYGGTYLSAGVSGSTFPIDCSDDQIGFAAGDYIYFGTTNASYNNSLLFGVRNIRKGTRSAAGTYDNLEGLCTVELDINIEGAGYGTYIHMMRPIEFEHPMNPFDAAWSLLTGTCIEEEARLDDTKGTDNADIDYASWAAGSVAYSTWEVGKSIAPSLIERRALPYLKDLGESCLMDIFVNEENRLAFRYFSHSYFAAGTIVISGTHYKVIEPEFDEANMVQKGRLWFALRGSMSSDERFGAYVEVESTTGSAIYGGKARTRDWSGPWLTTHSDAETALDYYMALFSHPTVPKIPFAADNLAYLDLGIGKTYLLRDETNPFGLEDVSVELIDYNKMLGGPLKQVKGVFRDISKYNVANFCEWDTGTDAVEDFIDGTSTAGLTFPAELEGSLDTEINSVYGGFHDPSTYPISLGSAGSTLEFQIQTSAYNYRLPGLWVKFVGTDVGTLGTEIMYMRYISGTRSGVIPNVHYYNKYAIERFPWYTSAADNNIYGHDRALTNGTIYTFSTGTSDPQNDYSPPGLLQLGTVPTLTGGGSVSNFWWG